MDEEFTGLTEKFMNMIEDEKIKIYDSSIKEYPEKQEFLRVEKDGSVVITEVKNERDEGILEDLNEKLLTIEREKQVLFLQLQKMESLRESEIKLHEAEEKISKLEE